ncbi:MAG: hypothetical protein LLG40_15830 [Deltaproteobacteria bacterium]|nr:hypothetical protein [Deltaproteobacteria bacterium]
MGKIIKTNNIAKTVVYIVGIVIIIFFLLVLLGGILSCFLFFKHTGKTIDKMILFNVLEMTIISIIYIVNAVYLLRLRLWARKFLLWFIPLSVIFDIIHRSVVDVLGASDAIEYVIMMIIWIILLNKNIKDVFKNKGDGSV